MDPWAIPCGASDPFQSTVDLREQIHHLIFGSADVPAQGRPFVLRELTDTVCPGCWNPNGGTRRANCPYCQGEAYQFRERLITAVLFSGVAPVYKPAILGTGQYPAASFGYTDPQRATGYCEWSVFPDYERYTLPANSAPNKLFEIKADGNGRAVYDPGTHLPVRAAKWKILSVTPLFGDNGRAEFIELGLEKSVTVG